MRINNELTDDLPHENGVLQGSKLGPLLFTIHINHLIKNANNCSTHLFADDAFFYTATKDLHYLKTAINSIV